MVPRPKYIQYIRTFVLVPPNFDSIAEKVSFLRGIQVPVAFPQNSCDTTVAIPHEEHMRASKLDLLQGTLDLMVLQTLTAMGPQHGYGIARRIEQVSGDKVSLNQGTIYASLVRLQQRGWITGEWGVSSNNRKAKFYSITKRGRQQLSEDAVNWQRLSSVMSRVLGMQGEGGDQ
jgi:PadR family transcriptional regulator PadR